MDTFVLTMFVFHGVYAVLMMLFMLFNTHTGEKRVYIHPIALNVLFAIWAGVLMWY